MRSRPIQHMIFSINWYRTIPMIADTLHALACGKVLSHHIEWLYVSVDIGLDHDSRQLACYYRWHSTEPWNWMILCISWYRPTRVIVDTSHVATGGKALGHLIVLLPGLHTCLSSEIHDKYHAHVQAHFRASCISVSITCEWLRTMRWQSHLWPTHSNIAYRTSSFVFKIKSNSFGILRSCK